jgi:hypothetical protein
MRVTTMNETEDVYKLFLQELAVFRKHVSEP